MDGQKKQKLIEQCTQVLQENNAGNWTRPTRGYYPHQWLWDSCFIAIGLRHYNVKRAQREIKSLFRGQWKNGMLPNMILDPNDHYARRLWKSHLSSNAPIKYSTSAITQPPMVAEAVVKIGEKLSKTEAKKWYKSIFPELLAYHEWMYRERDPHHEGLVMLVHPWESGLDNNPAWIKELHLNNLPLWIRVIKNLRLDKIFNLARSKRWMLPAYQRINTIDALALFSIARRLSRRKHDTRLILRHAHLIIDDLAFNSILIRANTCLIEIANTINEQIPSWLWERIKKAPHALELLWSEADQQYYSRNFTTFELINEQSITTFLPLYAGTISKNKAKKLVELLRSRRYATNFPIPSVPINSKYFNEFRYWQGPSWVNTNWLIIEGLQRYGYQEDAQLLKEKTINMVENQGAHEYFNPLSGKGIGAFPFSWSAALTIDLLNQ